MCAVGDLGEEEETERKTGAGGKAMGGIKGCFPTERYMVDCGGEGVGGATGGLLLVGREEAKPTVSWKDSQAAAVPPRT